MRAEEMQGSEDDFREFYFGTYEAFCKYVRKMAGRESVVEDIVQESYCMAYACWDMLEGHPKPAGWLYKTAAYVAGNMRRRKENQALSLEMVRETEKSMCAADMYGAVETEIVLQNLLPEKEWKLLQKYYVEGIASTGIKG